MYTCTHHNTILDVINRGVSNRYHGLKIRNESDIFPHHSIIYKV